MAIGTTIDGLNVVTLLTAQDEVPLWDVEASGEPTKKITAQNLASSVKSLASLPNTTEMNNAITQSTANLKKIYRFTISAGAVAANANCPLADSYASDNLVYRDGNTIKFGFSGVVLLNVHLAAQSDNASTKRLWAKLNGANASVQMLVYGAYATADLSQVVQVDTSTAISIQAIEPLTVNGGSTGVSNIFVTILG